MLDVFVSHAWRFHPEWLVVNEIIEHNFSETIRNFSLPWHDPAVTPSSEYGRGFLERQLASQIQPVHLVLMLRHLFKVESNMKWLNLELEIAKRLDKEIIYLSEDDSTNKGQDIKVSELSNFFTLRTT
jgi:hypothetical protein